MDSIELDFNKMLTGYLYINADNTWTNPTLKLIADF